MFCTILVGSHLSIQGRLLRRLASGLVLVRAGNQTFAGRPVRRARG